MLGWAAAGEVVNAVDPDEVCHQGKGLVRFYGIVLGEGGVLKGFRDCSVGRRLAQIRIQGAVGSGSDAYGKDWCGHAFFCLLVLGSSAAVAVCLRARARA